MSTIFKWLAALFVRHPPSVQSPKKLTSSPPPNPRDWVLRKLNPKGYGLTREQSVNIVKLADTYLAICTLFKQPPRITSGYRSLDEQVDLYRRMGKKAPMGSAHCKAAAMDLADEFGLIYETLSQPENLLKHGIYLEHKSATPTWCHVQIIPPVSGRRIFYP